MKKLGIALLLGGVLFAASQPRAIEARRPQPRPLPSPALPAENHVGGPDYDGRHIRVDLPDSEHLKNKVGTDRAGLCVFTSIDMAARYQNEHDLIGLRDFMTQYPGGGWPAKVDKFIKQKAPNVEYVQNTTGDETMLDLALAKTGRIVCITYGYSPRYVDSRNRSGEIDHMVNLVHLDEKWGVILDNNFPENYEWMPRAELLRRWRMRGGGWLVVLLAPPPPPNPVN